MELVIITGLSGAGKSEAIRSFEDVGYFCVDNLPANLIPRFYELCRDAKTIDRIAIVCDLRAGQFFDHLSEALRELEENGVKYVILFLEADEDVLVRRFKVSRRRHPLAVSGGILEGIREEARRLEGIRGKAHRIIDTSRLTPRELKEMIAREFARSTKERMTVQVVSFSYKHGVPPDADLVFDVRFLPNPHWVDSLAPYTGKDAAVIDYIFKWPVTQQFVDRLFGLMDFLLPHYMNEGKSHLVVALGCSGGQHRSVAIADKLGEFLRSRGFSVAVEHRDLPKAEPVEVES